MKFEDIQRVNETIKTLDVKGKEYAEVNQRIKAFRMLYPEGCIKTEIVSLQDGVVVMKSNIYEYYLNNTDFKLLGSGIAYEKENSTFINKTSYIENCETSAVGRALAMCGIGIDTSVASAEEVQNAITQQQESNEKPKEKENLKMELEELIVETDTDREILLDAYKVKDMNSLTMAQMKQAIDRLKKRLGE